MKDTQIVPLQNSIIVKLLKVVFAIYFTITLTSTILHMTAEYNHVKNSVAKELQVYQNIFEPGLASALWDIDESQIRSTLQGMLESPIIVGIILEQVEDTETTWVIGTIPDSYEADNRTTFLASLNDNDDPVVFSQLFSHHFPIAYNSQDNSQWQVGKATLYSSTHIVFEKVQVGFTFIIVNAIIKTIALWFLFLWIGHRFVSHPLRQLAQAVSQFNLHNLKPINIVKKRFHPNELNALEDTFNTMANNLRQEIHERQRAEQELSTSNQYLDNIINAMPSIIIGVDEALHITHWNHKAQQQTGLNVEKVLGQPLSAVYPELALHRERVELALKLNAPQKISKMLNYNDGQAVYTDLTIYPLTIAKTQGAVLRLDDITQQVHLEDMMIQTEKMMSVGGLAAGMAHEINNPLGSILQGAQNIIRRCSPDMANNQKVAAELGLDLELMQTYMDQRGVTQFIQGIRDSGERASGIVANMLHFSRKSQSEMTHTQVSDLIHHSLELAANDYDLKQRYDFRHIDIHTQVDEGLPGIFCIPTEIEQVLLNLLKNAAQAMHQNSYQNETPNLWIRASQQHYYVRIEVEDNGPGMSEDTRKRVFEPFFTTKEAGVGTGLGLSVAYFIITKNHSGRMMVESTPGTGTKFSIELPLEQDISLDD